ncbi:hypothetical protein F511_24833 [Dorcoceras hygrometricum]|uniref:Dystroglycan-like n=1 Tax=Dorcoceras hygrometricum TaxID=472368 RepID=A0A2Z7AMU9_9LAMI|nr:hypothetical protein F511_24833 [Dorcoceras hygrometricum]
MVRMFKYLEEIGLNGFLEASDYVFEGAVTEFFANAKVITGTIVRFVANRKLVVTKDMFAEVFGLQTEGLVGFLDIPTETIVEMRRKSSGTDVSFRAPNRKKEMKMKYRLLHDIISKELCAKASSFDVVTSEKFDLMVAISAGFKVNWAQVLFQILIAMVHSPSRQSQGFVVQVGVLLQNLVKEDLGESVKLHPQKVLNNKSVHSYMKKNLNVVPYGETRNVSGATASEKQSTVDNIPSLTKKPEKEAGEMNKPEKAVVEKPKKKKEKVVQMVKMQKVVVQQPVEALIQAAPAKSKSGSSSEADSHPLAKLKKGDAAPKHKMVIESSDSESTVSLPMENIMKKKIGADEGSTVLAPGAGYGSRSRDTEEKTPEVERQDDDASTVADQEEHVECRNQKEMEAVTNKGAIVVRSAPEQSAQQSITSADCGRYRQSGPRPEPRLLHQPALEALTNSARTDSPRRVGRKRISGDDGRRRRRRTAGGGVWRGGKGRLSSS